MFRAVTTSIEGDGAIGLENALSEGLVGMDVEAVISRSCRSKLQGERHCQTRQLKKEKIDEA